MKKIILSLLLIVVAKISLANGYSTFDQEPVMLVPYKEYGEDANLIKDLVWNKYSSENFTILGLNNEQAKTLAQDIKNIKNNCLKRWGLPYITANNEYRIMLTPNKELLKKLFGIQSSKIEFRDGVVAMWISADDLQDVLPEFLMMATLYESHPDSLFSLRKGVSILSSSNNNVRNVLGRISESTSEIDFLNLSEKDYRKMSREKREKFDTESTVLCLMLKKEFGEYKFIEFLDKGDIGLYGFNNETFTRSYQRYNKDLKNELLKNKVPDGYLNIEKR